MLISGEQLLTERLNEGRRDSVVGGLHYKDQKRKKQEVVSYER